MLTIARINPHQGQSYYQKEAYYKEGAALENSEWWGDGAKAFGLSGQIENSEAYKNLVNGFSPDGKQQLRGKPKKRKDGSKKQPKERAGLDGCFAAPKSVSLALLVGGDKRLEQAHQNAVRRTLEILQRRYAETRVKGERVKTGKLIVAMWHHDTSRELDPHLHTHCIILNATQLPDGKWQSLADENIFINKILLGQIYRSELAAECRKLGYEIEPHPKELFEIKGYTREQIEAFSRRHEQIVTKLKEGGKDVTTENKVWAWRQTRTKKNHEVNREELYPFWQEEAELYGITHPVPQYSQVTSPEETEAELQKALSDGIEHCSERKVAFKTEEVEKFISTEIRPFGLSQVELALKQRSDIIPTIDGRFTTQHALQREEKTIELMRAGKSQVAAIVHPEIIDGCLEEKSLTQGQRAAIELAAVTQDQFIAWQGKAGAGKTYALQEFKLLAQAQGYTIKGYAPSTEATKVLGEELGIETNTVASLILSKQTAQPQSQQIWVVDEAGLLSAKDALALLKRATAEQARVILVGDTRQMSAVEAGAPFRSLQEHGIQTAYLNQSLRQKVQDLKEAADLISDNKIAEGIERLEVGHPVSGSRIEILPEQAERAARITADFMQLSPVEREKTLILTGTNAERLAITAYLRAALKLEGTLGYGLDAIKLRDKNLSLVEGRYAHHYEVGNVVVPTRKYRGLGLQSFQPYVVEAVERDRLTLSDLSGNTITVDPMQFRKEVYARESIEIAVGDRLRWTKKDKELGHSNGQEFTVVEIDGSTATIAYKNDDIEKVDLNQPLHLDYALVSTTYNSQGKTASRVLISTANNRTVNRETFYVAISRVKHELKIYAECREALLEKAVQSGRQENPRELIHLSSVVKAEPLVAVVEPPNLVSQPPAHVESSVLNQENTDVPPIESAPSSQQFLAPTEPTRSQSGEVQTNTPQFGQGNLGDIPGLDYTLVDGEWKRTDKLEKTQKNEAAKDQSAQNLNQPQKPNYEQPTQPISHPGQPQSTDGASHGTSAGESIVRRLESDSQAARPDRTLGDQPIAANAEPVEFRPRTAETGNSRPAANQQPESIRLFDSVSTPIGKEGTRAQSGSGNAQSAVAGSTPSLTELNNSAASLDQTNRPQQTVGARGQQFERTDSTAGRSPSQLEADNRPVQPRYRTVSQQFNEFGHQFDQEGTKPRRAVRDFGSPVRDVDDRPRSVGASVQQLGTAESTAGKSPSQSGADAQPIQPRLTGTVRQFNEFSQQFDTELTAPQSTVRDFSEPERGFGNRQPATERPNTQLRAETRQPGKISQQPDRSFTHLVEYNDEIERGNQQLENPISSPLGSITTEDGAMAPKTSSAIGESESQYATTAHFFNQDARTLTRRNSLCRGRPQPTPRQAGTRNVAPIERIGRTGRQFERVREDLSTLTAQLRTLPLPEVAERLGLVHDKRQRVWKADGFKIGINEERSLFNDLKNPGMNGIKGGGAVNLTMYVLGKDFKQARDWLAKEFGMTSSTSYVPQFPPRPLKQTPAVEPERRPFVPPVPDEKRWAEVRDYLTRQRSIPAPLVDQLHLQGRIYASGVSVEALEKLRAQGYDGDKINNLVSLRRDENGVPTGAALRGISDKNGFKGLAENSRRNEGYFSFTQGEGELEQVVVTEAAIDAMSAAALKARNTTNPSSRTMFVATDGSGAIPVRLMQQTLERGGQVVLAQDADLAGETQAWKMLQTLGSGNITRRIPRVGKDLNDELRAAGTNQNQQWVALDKWSLVAQALGKSENYIERVKASQTLFESGGTLSQSAQSAMSQDFEQWRETNATLWKWHQVARKLSKSETYQQRIAAIALSFNQERQPVPIPEKAVVAMREALIEYEQSQLRSTAPIDVKTPVALSQPQQATQTSQQERPEQVNSSKQKQTSSFAKLVVESALKTLDAIKSDVCVSDNYRLARQGETVVIVARDGRGEIARSANGVVTGAASLSDASAIDLISRSVQSEQVQKQQLRRSQGIELED